MSDIITFLILILALLGILWIVFFPIIGRKKIYRTIAKEFGLNWEYKYLRYYQLGIPPFNRRMGSMSGTINGYNVIIYDAMFMPFLLQGLTLGSKKTVFEKNGQIDKEISHFLRFASRKEIEDWIKNIK
jgi:hypothetical protein